MNKDKKEKEINKLEFNTYSVFEKEEKNVREVIGMIFKDYIEHIKSNEEIKWFELWKVFISGKNRNIVYS